MQNEEWFCGFSTETKPTGCPMGTKFFELDTKCTYIWDLIQWTRDPTTLFGAEKHPTINISISVTSCQSFMSPLWVKPGRTLINILTTTPVSTGVTFTLTVLSAESTLGVFFTSTEVSGSVVKMLPVTTLNYGVPIADGGVYFNAALTAVVPSTSLGTITITPYTM
jgi:hypothetical protein